MAMCLLGRVLMKKWVYKHKLDKTHQTEDLTERGGIDSGTSGL